MNCRLAVQDELNCSPCCTEMEQLQLQVKQKALCLLRCSLTWHAALQHVEEALAN